MGPHLFEPVLFEWHPAWTGVNTFQMRSCLKHPDGTVPILTMICSGRIDPILAGRMLLAGRMRWHGQVTGKLGSLCLVARAGGDPRRAADLNPPLSLSLYIYIYIYIHTYLPLSICVCTYIYIYIVCVYIYIYIYIHIIIPLSLSIFLSLSLYIYIKYDII